MSSMILKLFVRGAESTADTSSMDSEERRTVFIERPVEKLRLDISDRSVAACLLTGLELVSEREAVAILRECRRVLVYAAHLRVGIAQPSLLEQHDLSRLGRIAGLRHFGRYRPNESTIAALRGLEGSREPPLVVELERVEVFGNFGDPLVSVLIPAYKATHYRHALESVIAQTWRHLEVVVTDDSPDDTIVSITQEVRAAHPDVSIRYYRNPRQLGSGGNYIRAFELALGTFVKALSDDDLLYPECVERQVRCLQAYPEVTLVTSNRDLIDASGQRIASNQCRPVSVDSIVDGVSAASVMLATKINYIGEPSTTLMRRDDLWENRPHMFSFGEVPSHGNGDVSMYLSLLARGDLVYLIDTLSAFRIHANQQQGDSDIHAAQVSAWDFDQDLGRRYGLYDPTRRAVLRTRPLDVRPWWSATVRDGLERLREAKGRGDDVAARQELASIAAESPGDVALELRVARERIDCGELQAAVPVFVKSMRAHPQHVEAYLGTVRALVAIGDLANAQSLFATTCKASSFVTPLEGVRVADSKGSVLLEGESVLRIAAVTMPLCLSLSIVVPALLADALPVRLRAQAPGHTTFEYTVEAVETVQSFALDFERGSEDLDVQISWRSAGRSFDEPALASEGADLLVTGIEALLPRHAQTR